MRLGTRDRSRRLRDRGARGGLRIWIPSAALTLAVICGLAPAAHAVKVAGKVSDPRGQGVADVDLDFDDATTGLRTRFDGETNAFGFYVVEVDRGVYHVNFDPPLVSRLIGRTVRSVSVQRDTPLDVVLADGVILTGTVLDPNGGPVAGADVDVDDQGTGQRVRTPDDDTDSLGMFRVVVPVGMLRISVTPLRGSGLAPIRIADVPVAGDTAIVVHLEPGVHLTGVVRDPSGAPIVGADIDVIDSNTGSRLSLSNDRSDEGGAFDVLIPPGRFHAAFTPQVETGLAGTLLVHLDVPRDTSLDIECRAGATLDLTVRGVFGELVAGADFDFVRPDGLQQPVWEDVTDLAGTLVAVLPAGTYDVVVTPPFGTGLAAIRRPIDVAVSAPLEFSLPAAGTPPGLQVLSVFPNPTNLATEIRLAAPWGEAPRSTIFDVLGRRVAQVTWSQQSPGYFTGRWDGRDRDGRLLMDGVYQLVIEAGVARTTVRLVRMR